MAPGVYLYCIGRAGELASDQVSSLEARPADGSDNPLRTIEHDDLAALVSDTTVKRFEIERDGLMAHHKVLEEAMKLGDILPISFGTVAETDQDVLEGLITPTADQLRENLEYIRGRVELSLRVMWKQDTLFQEIVEESDEVRMLRDTIVGVPEEQSYYERIRLGELTSGAIESKREFESGRILERLAPLCVDWEVNPVNSDTLVLNSSFLVDRERESEFDEAVQEVAAPRQGRMIFRYLGPLPPASFVSVSVDAGE